MKTDEGIVTFITNMNFLNTFISEIKIQFEYFILFSFMVTQNTYILQNQQIVMPRQPSFQFYVDVRHCFFLLLFYIVVRKLKEKVNIEKRDIFFQENLRIIF